MRFLVLVALLSVQLSLSASVAAAQPLVPGAAMPSGDYKLGTGDKLRIIVFGEDNLGGQYEVDSSGYISLPLIGQVRAVGLGMRELEVAIKAALEQGYLKDARVSAEVINYRPFYIIGEVQKPGEYAYVNDMSVLNAVALAGGYTNRANERTIYVRRNGSQDEESAPADSSTKIMPGDIIRIRERFF
jgi:polysaccharide export outer membrane protein